VSGGAPSSTRLVDIYLEGQHISISKKKQKTNKKKHQQSNSPHARRPGRLDRSDLFQLENEQRNDVYNNRVEQKKHE
jgi:hypothetical protein